MKKMELKPMLAKNTNGNISCLGGRKSLTTVAGYDLSKYNALKHGILSKYTVMDWENKDDYESLLNSLIEEYAPKGITEEHLIEELAGIIWRKMRLKYAEMASTQASLNKHIKIGSSYDGHESAKDSLLPSSDQVKGFDITEVVLATEDETRIDLKQTKERFNYLLKVEKILLDSNCYDQGLEALDTDDHDDWQKYISRYDEHDVTAEELSSWVNRLSERCEKRIYELENRGKIKKQVLGRAFLSDSQLNTYSRYENHLDRKFEKTLAMLLKLKDLRS
jgi:hypothetical protein